MPFVVKAVFPTGQTAWLRVARGAGGWSFAPREIAEVFKTRDSAVGAIGEVVLSHRVHGVRFSVEAAD
jgi:hypothetical protein